MRTLLASAGLAIAILLSGCGNMMKGKADAEKGVTDFHTLLDQEKYAEIYTAADKDFQAATPQEKLTKFLGTVHRKLGNVTGSATKNWTLNTFNGKNSVVLRQETTFERGKGVETFTYVLRDGKALLLGYNINSDELID